MTCSEYNYLRTSSRLASIGVGLLLAILSLLGISNKAVAKGDHGPSNRGSNGSVGLFEPDMLQNTTDTATATHTPTTSWTPTVTDTLSVSETPTPAGTMTPSPTSTVTPTTGATTLNTPTGVATLSTQTSATATLATALALTPDTAGTSSVITSTITLIPLPTITFQFPHITDTASLLAMEHPLDAPTLSKQNATSRWAKLSRLWPLAALLIIWLGIAVWFMLSQRY
jgi:hypothetical protein